VLAVVDGASQGQPSLCTLEDMNSMCVYPPRVRPMAHAIGAAAGAVVVYYMRCTFLLFLCVYVHERAREPAIKRSELYIEY
jgi:hypothetical protein